MTITQQIAKHLREVYLGGNWTGSNLKEAIKGVNWEQATKSVNGLNSIAALVFHINYYVEIILKVLKALPLEGHDKLSFNLPPIRNANDWEQLKQSSFSNAEVLAQLIEQLPDTKLSEPFDNGKYGNYYRNFEGLLEHTHYHLGQIVIIRKLNDKLTTLQ